MQLTESVSGDIKQQLQASVKRSPEPALQIDESADVVGLAPLLLFVRCCFEEIAQEEFMFCLPLSE
jgi:hypothetical protein